MARLCQNNSCPPPHPHGARKGGKESRPRPQTQKVLAQVGVVVPHKELPEPLGRVRPVVQNSEPGVFRFEPAPQHQRLARRHFGPKYRARDDAAQKEPVGHDADMILFLRSEELKRFCCAAHHLVKTFFIGVATAGGHIFDKVGFSRYSFGRIKWPLSHVRWHKNLMEARGRVQVQACALGYHSSGLLGAYRIAGKERLERQLGTALGDKLRLFHPFFAQRVMRSAVQTRNIGLALGMAHKVDTLHSEKLLGSKVFSSFVISSLERSSWGGAESSSTCAIGFRRDCRVEKRARKSSSPIKSIESLPPFSFGSIATRVPSASVSSFSILKISGEYKYSFLRTLSNAMRRAILSVSRTVRRLSIISLKSTSCSSARSDSINSGLVWPSVILPSESASCIACGRRSRRMVLLTYSRLLPTFSATSVCLNPNCLVSCSNALARSVGLRSSRWRFSIIASSSFVVSSSSPARMSTGTEATPANLAARNRRSPAISSYSLASPPSGLATSMRVTVSGWITPYWRIERARSASLASSNSLRGWNGFGFILSTSTPKIALL